GLDVIARQELRDLLLEWNRDEGLTVFLTSHDAGDVERVARRVIVINHGRVVLDDKVSALRRQYLGSKVLSVKFHEPPTPFSLCSNEHSALANGVFAAVLFYFCRLFCAPPDAKEPTEGRTPMVCVR